MNPSIIKVCGMKNPENILQVETAGADWIGLIFWNGSSRYISPEKAESVRQYLSTRHTDSNRASQVSLVGVFVDASPEYILQTIQTCHLDLIQLHGKESPDYCYKLKSLIFRNIHRAIPLIKAINVSVPEDLTSTAVYETCCDYFLFDTKSSVPGGSGQTFDWQILNGYSGKKTFLLSGGIQPADIPKIRSFHHPACIGIDLNSRFEQAPGLKDVQKISTFIQALRSFRPIEAHHKNNIKNKTMNRITTLFENKKQNLLSVYFCAGHPTLESTPEVIQALAKDGIDMIEIGIPFSDPMADGPVIQDAARKALHNGMKIRILFEQLKNIRDTVQIPLLLMGYLNPIMQYGFDRFCIDCKKCGIDGLIIPDLPFQEYLDHYKPIADQYDLKIIMLITPATSETRIHTIDRYTDGFIYMVSTAATTGARNSFEQQHIAYFDRVNKLSLRNPRMIGFGISNKQTTETARKYAAGIIIGSKFVSILDREHDPQKAVGMLLQALTQ